MSVFIISYDLHQEGQNYKCLIERIKAHGSWCHLQRSVWLINASTNSIGLRDSLSVCLDKNDQLFVAELSGDAAWNGYSSEISNWIKETA